ncbi:hypothetical protein A9Q78_04025 [Methylophaga sp. 41_12_T18]|nr:hypothetical protein A9Q78_04025 [Methylophaga sp. 41_12_T18]
MKRIVICTDGTWNRPEQIHKDDYPTNVLKFARGIASHDQQNIKQVVFYDWGIGSYHDKFSGGSFGEGLEKNVMDAYRFLVHNYEAGDEIYLFGFSRGAYTIRSLCGLMNNCSLLKPAEGKRIEQAFALYKNKRHKPNSPYSHNWRADYAVQQEVNITFVGVWDTVGAMGLPFSVFGLIKDKHLFYDRKLGSNVVKARHALSLDELRDDFEPTIWEPKPGVDLKQVWFAGVHSDVGGSYKPDTDNTVLADIPMLWLQNEAISEGLKFDDYLANVTINPHASQHNEYKGKYRLLGKRQRVIPQPNKIPSFVHRSVKQRYQQGYTSKTIEAYIAKYGQWPPICD